MRTHWIASVVFLLGALACALQRRDDLALIFAMIGFQLVFVADSDIDWKQCITRGNWREQIFEPRFKSTIVAKLAQVLSFVCLLLFFVTTDR